MKERPRCFGMLDRVFPMGEDGLRETPETCFPCRLKTDCLRAAVAGADGIRVHEEVLDRAYRSGAMGFLERWSRKKTLDYRKRGNLSPQKHRGHGEEP